MSFVLDTFKWRQNSLLRKTTKSSSAGQCWCSSPSRRLTTTKLSANLTMFVWLQWQLFVHKIKRRKTAALRRTGGEGQLIGWRAVYPLTLWPVKSKVKPTKIKCMLKSFIYHSADKCGWVVLINNQWIKAWHHESRTHLYFVFWNLIFQIATLNMAAQVFNFSVMSILLLLRW